MLAVFTYKHQLTCVFIQAKQKLATQEKETTPLRAPEPDILYHSIEIEIRCGDPAVLTSYNQFIVLAAKHLNLNIEHKYVMRVKCFIVINSLKKCVLKIIVFTVKQKTDIM